MYKYYILIYKKINVWKYLYNYLKFKSIFRGETTVCNILANVLHNAWNYTNLNNIQLSRYLLTKNNELKSLAKNKTT